MRFLVKFLILHSGLLFYSTIQSGCCTDRYEIIGNGEIIAFDPLLSVQILDVNDTIRNDTFTILWALGANYSSVDPSSTLSDGLLYATSCAEEFVNRTVAESLTISCRKPFRYAGSNIEPDTDFSTIETITIEVDGLIGESVRIVFLSDFLNQSDLKTGTYTFDLSIETTDGQMFDQSIELVFERS